MRDEDEQPLLDLELPPEFDRAPAWARTLAHRMQRLHGTVDALQDSLGKEPNSDGKGGEGLIGDVRKMGRDLSQLMNLRTMGIGFFGALTVFGAVILLGITHFIQSVTGAAK